jgi:hypothetical protein
LKSLWNQAGGFPAKFYTQQTRQTSRQCRRDRLREADEIPASYRSLSGIDLVSNGIVRDANFLNHEWIAKWQHRSAYAPWKTADRPGRVDTRSWPTPSLAISAAAFPPLIWRSPLMRRPLRSNASAWGRTNLTASPVDLEDLVRVTNALIRVRTELGKRAKPADEGFDWVQLQEEAARMIREEDAQRRQGANDSPQRSETAWSSSQHSWKSGSAIPLPSSRRSSSTHWAVAHQLRLLGDIGSNAAGFPVI